MFHDVAGLVLAGGRGTRMGARDKCQVRVDGVPVVRRVLGLLGGLFDELVLVTNNPEQYGDLRAAARPPRLTRDRYEGRGPLGGIHAGLSAARAPAAFCVACDMPFLDEALIRRQVDEFRALATARGPGAGGACEALVPRFGELIEPLHAVYACSLAGPAERILSARGPGAGYSVRLLLAEARTVYWDLESSPATRTAFFNVNTPKDLISVRRTDETRRRP